MEERRNGMNGSKEEWHEWKRGGMVALLRTAELAVY